MSEYVLHESFFKKNPLKKISTAVLADFTLTIQFDDEILAEMKRDVGEHLSDERHIQIAKENERIEKLDSGEAVVAFMRKEHDYLANPAFFKKALTLEEEAAPMIIQRYKTTGQDHFVEAAFRVLAKSDKKYTEQLFEEYAEIRNPFAQSMACLLFGEHEMEDAVPLLMKEYQRFKREYPEEDFEQAPLLALHILYGEA